MCLHGFTRQSLPCGFMLCRFLKFVHIMTDRSGRTAEARCRFTAKILPVAFSGQEESYWPLWILCQLPVTNVNGEE